MKHRVFLLIVLMQPLISVAAPSLEVTKQEEAERLQLMQSMTYTDNNQCHIQISKDATSASIVNMLVAAHTNRQIDKAAVMIALETAIKRGCDVNELDDAGLSPLAAAILFNDAVMVKFLLANGADIGQTIKREGSKVDGMTAQQFLNWLLENAAEKGDTRDRSEIQGLLAEAKR